MRVFLQDHYKTLMSVQPLTFSVSGVGCYVIAKIIYQQYISAVLTSYLIQMAQKSAFSYETESHFHSD